MAELNSKDKGKYKFYKENEKDVFFEVDHIGYIGELLFSPDGKKIYNLWTDYPQNFTKEEKKIFDKEQPYWKEFFGA